MSYYYCLFLFFICTFSLLSLLFISFSLYKPTFRHKPKTTTAATAFSNDPQDQTTPKPQETERSDPDARTDPTHLTLEIVPSDTELGPGQKKKRKKKKKKDKTFNNCTDSRCEEEEKEKEKEKEKGKRFSGLDSGKPDLVCLYPFTSSGSATQRRIKQHFDQLVKCNESKGLTLAQVGEFANCLIEARNELQHKSEVIQRKFTITKALLLKADRSSFDRLRQQIYKLELEQKRLEEDAFVYNWLQQQLKLSPAYKKMLEISSSVELKAQSSEVIETEDSEFPDISFEELLAQEKKDSFWQKMGKSRSCSN